MTTEPPVAAEYQVIPVVEANASLAFRVCMGLVWHCEILPELEGAAGAGVIVKVTPVLALFKQVLAEYSA